MATAKAIDYRIGGLGKGRIMEVIHSKASFGSHFSED
jgi:hypothetical protein